MRHILRHNHVSLLLRMECRCIVHGGGNDPHRPTPQRLSRMSRAWRLLHLRLHSLLQYGTFGADPKTLAANAVLPTSIMIHVHTSRIGALAELTQYRTVLAQDAAPKSRAHSGIIISSHDYSCYLIGWTHLHPSQSSHAENPDHLLLVFLLDNEDTTPLESGEFISICQHLI